jgi:uncharacterized protein YukE
MASNYTAVHPESLLAQSSRFRTAAETGYQTAHDLEHGSSSIGRCWGTDDVGQAFQEAYADTANQLRDGVFGVQDLMRSIGEGLGKAARTYQAAEEAAQKTVS